MSPAEKQAREEQADRKSGEAAGKRYNALSSVAPSKDSRDDVRGQKGYKKGGMVKKSRYEGGGEIEDKETGLKASKGEDVGFFERLRMGNIDEEGSEAYNRFGAGRGKAERAKNVPVEDRVATPVNREKLKAEAAPMDELEEANMREPIAVTSGKKAEPDSSTKLTTNPPELPKPSVKIKPMNLSKTDKSNYSNEGRSSPTTKTGTSNYSNEGRGREMNKRQQADYQFDSVRPTKEQTQQGLETASSMMGGAGLKALQGLAKKAAGSTAPKAANSRELSTAVDDGVTFLGKSGRRQVGGFPEVGGSTARQLANNPTRQLPAPPKQISGPSKSELVAKNRAARKTARKESMDEENAARHGLDRKDPDFDEKAKKVRENIGGDEFTLGMKRCGKVKSMSSGGASKPEVKGWGMARGARPAKMR